MEKLSIMAKACDKKRQNLYAVFYSASKNEFMSTDGRVMLIQKAAPPGATDKAIDPVTFDPINPDFAPTAPAYERIEFDRDDPRALTMDSSCGDLYVRLPGNKNIAREVVCVGGVCFDKKYIKLIAEFLGRMPRICARLENVFRFDGEDGTRRAYLAPLKPILADAYKQTKQGAPIESLCKVKPPAIVFAVKIPGDASVRVFKNKKQADDVAKSLNTEVIPVLVEG